MTIKVKYPSRIVNEDLGVSVIFPFYTHSILLSSMDARSAWRGFFLSNDCSATSECSFELLLCCILIQCEDAPLVNLQLHFFQDFCNSVNTGRRLNDPKRGQLWFTRPLSAGLTDVSTSHDEPPRPTYPPPLPHSKNIFWKSFLKIMSRCLYIITVCMIFLLSSSPNLAFEFASKNCLCNALIRWLCHMQCYQVKDRRKFSPNILTVILLQCESKNRNTLIWLWHFNCAMTNQIRDKKSQATKLITVTTCGFFILHLIGLFLATQ